MRIMGSTGSMRGGQTCIAMLAALLLTGFLGCAAPTPYFAQKTPLTLGPGGSAPVTFTKLIFAVPAGTAVGTHYAGFLQVPKFSYVWQSNLSMSADDFRTIASERLRSAGYTVIGGDNTLFSKDDTAAAKFWLGGTVQALQHDTHGEFAGEESMSSMDVAWQLYDAKQEKVIYSITTSGYGTQPGVGPVSVQSAFASALDNLLAEPAFVAKVKAGAP